MSPSWIGPNNLSPMTNNCAPLFVAERFNRIELGGLVGGEKTEGDADHGAHAEGDEDPERGEQHGPAVHLGDDLGGADAREHAKPAAHDAEDDGLDEELREH